MKTKVTVNLNKVNDATKFVSEISKFNSDVDIISGRHVCDAKSLLGVFSFDLSKPVDIEIHSDNENEIKRFNEVMWKFK